MTFNNDPPKRSSEFGDGTIVDFRHGARVEEIAGVIELEGVNGFGLDICQGDLELSRNRTDWGGMVCGVLPEVAEHASKRAFCTGKKDGAGSANLSVRAALDFIDDAVRPPRIDRGLGLS
jgi:hypothetical protein